MSREGWESPPGPGPFEVEDGVLVSRPLPKTAGPLGGMNRTPANHMMSNAPVHLRPPPRTAPSGGGRGSERRPTGATVSSTKDYQLRALLPGMEESSWCSSAGNKSDGALLPLGRMMALN